MLVYVVRHGQSEANLKNEHAGQNSVPLTEKGIEDARRAGNMLENIRFDRVFSSDQVRALQTARTALPAWKPETDARLREIHVGTLAGLPVPECEKRYGEAYKKARKARDFTEYGGESDDMQYARAAEFMRKLETIHGCENVAVFCHGGTIRCMCEYILGCRFSMEKLRIANGSVTVMEYRDGRWSILFR